MLKESHYQKNYKELEIIGKGNFGQAVLIKNKATGQIFVAKKIILSCLPEKEQHQALQEAKLLKNLNHPNIVKYIESFVDQGFLVIIMEYCEEGDLAFHIKRKVQKQEYFPEKLILNWFLQILLAIKYIHDRKVLHRDIKSSNIFLTSKGTIKLGDFGISKLLDTSLDKAITVVGTPYYLSPEACQSQGYTYRSDIWAVGCVLYELCTLKHAFDASNLLSLLYKIIQQKEEAIPEFFSQELKDLVSSLLQKEQKNRPTIKDIFQTQFIQQTMKDFIANEGKLMTTPIQKKMKVLQQNQESFLKDDTLDLNTLNSQDYKQQNKVLHQKQLQKTNKNFTNFTEKSETSQPSQNMKKEKVRQSEEEYGSDFDSYNEDFESYESSKDRTDEIQNIVKPNELLDIISIYKNHLKVANDILQS